MIQTFGEDGFSIFKGDYWFFADSGISCAYGFNFGFMWMFAGRFHSLLCIFPLTWPVYSYLWLYLVCIIISFRHTWWSNLRNITLGLYPFLCTCHYYDIVLRSTVYHFKLGINRIEWQVNCFLIVLRAIVGIKWSAI